MKKHLLAGFLALSFVSGAQDVDPMKYFMIEYNVPPRTQDFSSARNFFIEASNSTPFEIKKAVENEINPNYYLIVADPSLADVRLQINTSSSNASPKKYSATTEEKTDSKGKKYTVTNHKYQASYKYSAMIEMYNAQGQIVRSVIENGNSTLEYTDTDMTRADQKFEDKRTKDESSWLNSLIMKCYMALENDYFYALETARLAPLELKSRKYDYTDLNEASTTVLLWMEGKNYSLENEPLKKAMVIFQETAGDVNKEERKARVNSEVGALCDYMLALVYFCSKDYAKANELILASESLDKRLHSSQEAIKDSCKKLKDKNAF
ncbi:MAG: hypothetical protein K0R65_1258 [Crocinitomicaceae bacterium]|jgi:hypothetical protein|nr:hypothetical protein [Crocinitomicaceae bacterium]